MVVFRVACGGRLGRGVGVCDSFAAVGRVVEAEAGCPVGAFAFGEAEIDEDAVAGVGVVEEVCGFDVPVQNVLFVDGVEGAEEGAEIGAHGGGGEVVVV